MYNSLFFIVMLELSYNSVNNNLQRVLNFVQKNEPACLPYFAVMYNLGIRASESFNFNLWSLENQNFIILRPLKYNDVRVFSLEEIPISFLNLLHNNNLTNYKVNYSRLNYLYNSGALYNNIYIGNKSTTLHLFRHIYVKRLILRGFSDIEIKNNLGERNLKSALAYINSKFHIPK